MKSLNSCIVVVVGVHVCSEGKSDRILNVRVGLGFELMSKVGRGLAEERQ